MRSYLKHEQANSVSRLFLYAASKLFSISMNEFEQTCLLGIQVIRHMSYIILHPLLPYSAMSQCIQLNKSVWLH